MTWRTVVISQPAKLDIKMETVVIRTETTVSIAIAEIGLLIIENTAVSLTAALLSELTKRKVKIIFCDEKRNPQSELISYYGSHDTSAKIREQIAWEQNAKEVVWTSIVHEKISQQKRLLDHYEKQESTLLEQYLQDIQLNDASNKEGHAAKVYFNALFGKNFSRKQPNSINIALNYGYSILLSAINREIVSNGFCTQLGIHHDNTFNQFNLGCDLLEPWRILVDTIVCKMAPKEFTTKEKYVLVDILNQQVLIDNKQHVVMHALKIYCKSIFLALQQQNIQHIKFYHHEL